MPSPPRSAKRAAPSRLRQSPDKARTGPDRQAQTGLGGSIAVVIRFEGTVLGHADVGGLLGSQLGQLGADLAEVQPGDLLVEAFGQRIDLLVVFALIGEELDLRQRLVGEGGRHHKARVAHGVAQIYEPTLREQDDALSIREGDLVHLRLDVVPLEIAQARYLDLIVEVADVGDDGAVLHGAHVVERDDILIAGRCDEDVGARRGVLHGGYLIALHGRLQRADWVDLRYRHAAAVEVVKFGFGYAVIDIDGGPHQRALLLHLVEPVDARGGLLRDALDG